MVQVLAPLHDHHGERRSVVRGLPVHHCTDGPGAWQRVARLGNPEFLDAIAVVWWQESHEGHEGRAPLRVLQVVAGAIS